MMFLYEVHYRLPGGVHAGERLLAHSAHDAGRVVLARNPGAEITYIVKID